MNTKAKAIQTDIYEAVENIANTAFLMVKFSLNLTQCIVDYSLTSPR